jgi:hypothetical protein
MTYFESDPEERAFARVSKDAHKGGRFPHLHGLESLMSNFSIAPATTKSL